MNGEDAALRWGLPAGFVPVRFPIGDDVKDLLRPLLSAAEPAVVSLANLEGTVTVVGTPKRLFVVRSGEAMAGAAGVSMREFPWEGVTRLTLSHAGPSAKIAVGFKTTNGRNVEVGRRAALGRDAVENAMPFDAEQGQSAFAALHQIWQHVKQGGSPGAAPAA